MLARREWNNIHSRFILFAGGGAVPAGGSGFAIEPHDGGDEESRCAHRNDDRSGDDEGRGESHVLGQESRAQQSEGRGQQPETPVGAT